MNFDFCGKLRQNVGMSQSVRLSDELVNDAKEKAKLFHRSPPQQIEHWAAIGKILEPALAYEVQENITQWGSEDDISQLMADVESKSGRAKTKKLIRETSGFIAASDA